MRRLLSLAAAALVVIGAGLLAAYANRVSCDGPCPAPLAEGADQFWFYHRDLGPSGSITVRLTSMTGTVTYPPRPGLVPWAKTGIIVKDGVRPGSPYAALLRTGSHGVRFQHNFKHDVAAGEGNWLRLTRSGDTITGAQSADGRQWHTVGAATLAGLPATAQVGLFATSPGALTVLRGGVQQSRFTQAVGAFDNVALTGSDGAAWRSEPVGEANATDWEKYHHASGAVEQDGVITVSGTGDIGPVSDQGALTVRSLLPGLPLALIILLLLGARPGWQLRSLALAVFLTGLVSVGVTVVAGLAVLRAHDIPVQPLSLLTGARVVVGLAAVLALCAVLAQGLTRWTRRPWLASVIALVLVGVPYLLTALPLLPDAASEWLLRLTPAAGFAVQQTLVEYPQVIAHYAPSGGYFPLPWWGGLAILMAYVTAAAGTARFIR